MSFSRKPKYEKVERGWVYSRIQTRMGENPIDEDVLMDYIEEVESVICNYINRTYVPEPLKFVFMNMTMDLMKSQALTGFLENDDLSDLSVGAVASIKDGDSEIKFKTSASTGSGTGAHIGDVDALLYNYTNQLDKYRLVKW